MTQEFIAHMLGGRRETVTVAAGRLQDAGLIRYTRGRLTIVNRKGLEDSVCECYRPFVRGSNALALGTEIESSHCARLSVPRSRVSSALS